MSKKLFYVAILAITLSFLFNFAEASTIGSSAQGTILSSAPDYEWWYGCSPTSAGMMMGYYDIKGYGGKSYSNLVPGRVAELTTFPSTDKLYLYQAQYAIASPGYIQAFYRNANSTDYGLRTLYFGVSGDDKPALHPTPDSLADYMGTSQDSVNSSNGSTWFYYFTNGSKFYATDAFNYSVWQQDGMFGMYEYVNAMGYAAPMGNFYTQLTDNQASLGFTFADYMAEIDAGRVVMIQVEGHSMFGYGYGPDNTVYLHETWVEGQDWMTWGGSFQGMTMWGVTAFMPSGGTTVPEPFTLLLLIPGLSAIVVLRRKLVKD
jgi:hypothetical protein